MTLANLADLERYEAWPLAERGWPQSTYETIVRAAALFGSKPALTLIDDAAQMTVRESLSFDDLLGRVRQMANLLHAAGSEPADVTAYFLPNLIETQIVLWGAEAAGIAFPLNTMLAPSHVVALLAEAGARVLITAPANETKGWEGWESLRPHLAACASLQRVYLADTSASSLAPAAGADERFEIFDLAAELCGHPSDRLVSDRAIGADDTSSYFCTGGTTGMPKLAMRSHAAEAANPQMFAAMLGDTLGPSSKLMVGLPLFHVNAAVTSLTTWLAGGEVVMVPGGFRNRAVIDNFWRIVETFRISFFSAVPTILSDLLDRPVNADVSSLRFAICGAAPLAVELFHRFEQATGLRILEGYGLTESICVAAINPIEGERRIGSVGLRLPYETLRCIEVDDEGAFQRDCAPDEAGLIVIAGPNSFKGYTEPQHNASVWIDCGGPEAWINTGDLGKIDDDGYLWLLGRRKELIIRGGHNIDPQQIEEALYAHPAVKLAAAIGRPDARLGEVPVAYVELRPGASASTDELSAFARRHIADRAAVPKQIHVISAMPTTPVGKISKIALAEWEVRALVEREAMQRGIKLSRLRIETRTDGPLVLVAGEGAEVLADLLSDFRISVSLQG